MADATPQPFRGFHPDALQFLVDLSLNNDRAWFKPRKADYERLLKEPLEALIVALADQLEKRDIPMTADPKRSPFRIYRDTRFSKDKSPYKTHLGADFPWRPPTQAPDPDAPAHQGAGGYFHLSPTGSYVGGGMWHPQPGQLEAWRKLVDRDPERVRAAIGDPRFVTVHGAVSSEGETYKRVPTGYAADHPEAELLKMKHVVFGRTLTDKEVESAKLPDLLADAYEAAVPVFRLLTSL